jgi:hypothetical protein
VDCGSGELKTADRLPRLVHKAGCMCQEPGSTWRNIVKARKWYRSKAITITLMLLQVTLVHCKGCCAGQLSSNTTSFNGVKCEAQGSLNMCKSWPHIPCARALPCKLSTSCPQVRWLPQPPSRVVERWKNSTRSCRVPASPSSESDVCFFEDDFDFLVSACGYGGFVCRRGRVGTRFGVGFGVNLHALSFSSYAYSAPSSHPSRMTTCNVNTTSSGYSASSSLSSSSPCSSRGNRGLGKVSPLPLSIFRLRKRVRRERYCTIPYPQIGTPANTQHFYHIGSHILVPKLYIRL